jgi:hypothetical protein
MPLKLSRNDSELAQNDHQVGHILSPGGLYFEYMPTVYSMLQM